MVRKLLDHFLEKNYCILNVKDMLIHLIVELSSLISDIDELVIDKLKADDLIDLQRK